MIYFSLSSDHTKSRHISHVFSLVVTMRFGQYFHRLINPEFEPYYIDYNQRKASIKELRLIDQNLGANHTPDPHGIPLKETPWRFGSSSDRLPNIGSLHHMVLQGDAEKLIRLADPGSPFDFGIVQLGQVLKYLILNRLDATAIRILELSALILLQMHQPTHSSTPLPYLTLEPISTSNVRFGEPIKAEIHKADLAESLWPPGRVGGKIPLSIQQIKDAKERERFDHEVFNLLQPPV
ncbi:hypothetical protein PG995_011435 [Apiospora arundinis]